jgi:UDP-N-acetylglucosamine acyltransferase
MTTTIVGLNRVGLRRAGYTQQDITQLKAAYRLVYRSGLPWTKVLDYLAADYTSGPAVKFGEFFSGGTRGFVPARRSPSGATLLLHRDNDDALEAQAKVG